MPEYGSLTVARCRDGRVIGGRCADFRPDRFFLHVYPPGAMEPVRVLRDDLKAMFFVKALSGNPCHDDLKNFEPVGPERRKVWVQFTDGEELAAWAEEIAPEDLGYTLFPVDPRSNINKMWIPRAAVRHVYLDDEAELAARAYEEEPREEMPRYAGILPRNWDELLGFEPATTGEPAPSGPSAKRDDTEMFVGEW